MRLTEKEKKAIQNVAAKYKISEHDSEVGFKLDKNAFQKSKKYLEAKNNDYFYFSDRTKNALEKLENDSIVARKALSDWALEFGFKIQNRIVFSNVMDKNNNMVFVL